MITQQTRFVICRSPGIYSFPSPFPVWHSLNSFRGASCAACVCGVVVVGGGGGCAKKEVSFRCALSSDFLRFVPSLFRFFSELCFVPDVLLVLLVFFGDFGGVFFGDVVVIVRTPTPSPSSGFPRLCSGSASSSASLDKTPGQVDPLARLRFRSAGGAPPGDGGRTAAKKRARRTGLDEVEVDVDNDDEAEADVDVDADVDAGADAGDDAGDDAGADVDADVDASADIEAGAGAEADAEAEGILKGEREGERSSGEGDEEEEVVVVVVVAGTGGGEPALKKEEMERWLAFSSRKCEMRIPNRRRVIGNAFSSSRVASARMSSYELTYLTNRTRTHHRTHKRAIV